ncbi:MAG: C39 family peptidase [Bacteroidetes bacterium]|nr:C39 family peptidase [Bacteroidota bacterium]
MLQTVQNNSPLAFLAPTQYFAGIKSNIMDSVYAKQNDTNWCWAACIEMIAKYNGVNISQEYFAHSYCGVGFNGYIKNCPAPVDIITENLNWCAYTGWDRKRTHCISTSAHHGTPNVETLITLLKANIPVIIAYNTGLNVGHAVVLSGISYTDGIFGKELVYVVVRDPANGKLVYRNPEQLLKLIYAWWVPTVTKYR